MDPIVLRLPVTDAVLGTVTLSLSLSPPDPAALAAPARWSLWLPGATYSGRGYFDPCLPPAVTPSYSMARALSRAGIGVITLDHLGTGQSLCPGVPGHLLTRQRYAALYVSLVHTLRERLLAGTLCQQVPPLASQHLWLLGGGHSLGASLLTAVQAEGAPFDAVALLGWTPGGGQAWAEGLAETIARAIGGRPAPNGFLHADRALLRPFFYGDPPVVPAAVIEADEAQAVSVPVGLLQQEDVLAPSPDPLAAQLRCPLYVCLARADLAADPSDQQRYYPGTTDFTCLLLQGAAHCANFAPTRRVLWEHLAAWTAAQAALHTVAAPLSARLGVRPEGGADASRWPG